MRFGDGSRTVDLDGTVRWCHLIGTRPGNVGGALNLYQAGLAFDGTMTEKSERLLDFMQEHVVLSLAKRVIGRFKLKAGAPVELAARYDFEVEKLSLSGMLVETRLLPEVDSAFDMELRIRGTTLEVEGRIAYVQRIGGTDANPRPASGWSSSRWTRRGRRS